MDGFICSFNMWSFSTYNMLNTATCLGYRAAKISVMPHLMEPTAGRQSLHYSVMCASMGKDKILWGRMAGDLSLPRGQGRLP